MLISGGCIGSRLPRCPPRRRRSAASRPCQRRPRCQRSPASSPSRPGAAHKVTARGHAHLTPWFPPRAVPNRPGNLATRWIVQDLSASDRSRARRPISSRPPTTHTHACTCAFPTQPASSTLLCDLTFKADDRHETISVCRQAAGD